MCGRFSLIISGRVLAKVFDTAEAPSLEPRYNIAPTQVVPIVRTDAGGLRFFSEARWGLVPPWAKDMKMGARLINARAETVASKPAFRSALRRRRCLVPADGFYEWRKVGAKKQPYYIHFVDSRAFAFAGLWELWKQADGQWLESFTIITTEPNSVVAPLHDRMPVILPPGVHGQWLQPGAPPENRLSDLLVPHSEEEMEAYPVSSRVGSPANDDEGCVTRLEQLSLF